MLSPNIIQAMMKLFIINYTLKIRLNFSSYLTRWRDVTKWLPHFYNFFEEPTCQFTEACPKISSKCLSRCAKLTKSLRETEKCFVSLLYLALFQSLFFFMKVLLSLSMIGLSTGIHIPFLLIGLLCQLLLYLRSVTNISTFWQRPP